MNRFIKLCSLVLLLANSAYATPAVSSETTDSEKTKSYSKSYAVTGSDKILLDNSFGEMKISTWSKNEVKVDVTMTVKAISDQRAQEILDLINIEDGKKGSEVFFKTHIRNDNKNFHDSDDSKRNRNRNIDRNDGDRTSFKINYTVYLPNNMSLEAVNQFGAMIIGDYDGPATLSSKFGSLTAGKLTQPKKVSVEFGKATIESITNGKLSINFSRALINRLSGDIVADFNQSHGVKIILDNNLKKLDINNNFSDVFLDADKGLSASFSIKSSFGSFSNKTDFPVTRTKEDEDRYYSKNQNYTGKSGNGNIPINVKNSFGHVTLGHDISFDVNEKTARVRREKA